ncbi:kinase-like domain-containing protein [Aspergillus unguis]
MQPRLAYDDVAWEKSEYVADSWVRQFLEPEILRPAGNFLVRHHRPGEAEEFSLLGKGSFNISFQMEYKDANSAIIRFVQPGATMFPEEKVRNEVATMRYIYDQTSIPVPFVYHWGTKKESPVELSPFIIMDYIDHDTDMYDALNRPDCPRQDRGFLDPDIRSLNQVDDFTWNVTQRPLSMPMNTLVQLGTLPQSKLPSTTFDTTSSYLEALAELHISHLISQRNDAISSAEDCRRKLVARYLFRKLARERRLTEQWASFDQGPFKLWCDDFRPANILLSEDLKIVGVADWEFTYAAPVEFTFAAPWWLLIEKPEYWAGGLDDWCTEYERRLESFLRMMKAEEDEEIAHGRLENAQRLSGPMRGSWDSGDFWIPYAARNNFAFDLIYWEKLDRRFFGPVSCPVDEVWKQRIDLLEPGERVEIEKIVAVKVEEMKTRPLAWDPDEYTKEALEKAEKAAVADKSVGQVDADGTASQ